MPPYRVWDIHLTFGGPAEWFYWLPRFHAPIRLPDNNGRQYTFLWLRFYLYFTVTRHWPSSERRAA